LTGGFGVSGSCGAGEVEGFDRPGLGSESAGDAEGCLGAGELRAEEGFVLAFGPGFGGDLRIASNFGPFIVSLISFRGRCPSKLVELEALSKG
jgi:hypothetical protein